MSLLMLLNLVSKFKGSVHGAGKALLSVIKQTTAKTI